MSKFTAILDSTRQDPKRRQAFQVIIIFGLISLFADIVYEGARGVNGAYLGSLGASAAMVGLIAGMGEFLGYALRLVSGWFADRSKAYWPLTIGGYCLLATVPLLALAGTWQVAGLLIVCERLAKAVRSPAKDTLLSHAAGTVGRGFGFGLHEAMDQIGALLGPLIFALVLGTAAAGAGTATDAADITAATTSQYRLGYAWLAIPCVLTIACVVLAFFRMPRPEVNPKEVGKSDVLGPAFWLYLSFSVLTTMGFASFALVAFHLTASKLVAVWMVPVIYAVAMIADGGAALVIGRLYDKKGLGVIILIPLLSIPVAFTVFASSAALVWTGMVVWGVVMGAHETIMKAAVADLTSIAKRGTGYGIFNTAYGLAAFAGAGVAGLLYQANLALVPWFLAVLQIPALAMVLLIRRRARNTHESGQDMPR